MASKLTNEMRADIAANSGAAVPVVDDQTDHVYFLVDEVSLLHMQEMAGQQDSTARKQLKALIQAGIDAQHIPAEVAEPRMRKMIQDCADKIA